MTADFIASLKNQRVILSVAESCTGGLLSSTITDISGASAVFDRGFITYSNDAKMEMLGVSTRTLEQFGAVSQQTALEMALGVLAHSKATHSISITGIAGPGGGTKEKPVGLVYFGFAQKFPARSGFELQIFKGDRTDIRQQAVEFAIDMFGQKFLENR